MQKIHRFISYTEQVYRELKAAILSEKLPLEEYLQERGDCRTTGCEQDTSQRST